MLRSWDISTESGKDLNSEVNEARHHLPFSEACEDRIPLDTPGNRDRNVTPQSMPTHTEICHRKYLWPPVSILNQIAIYGNLFIQNGWLKTRHSDSKYYPKWKYLDLQRHHAPAYIHIDNNWSLMILLHACFYGIGYPVLNKSNVKRMCRKDVTWLYRYPFTAPDSDTDICWNPRIRIFVGGRPTLFYR